MERREEGRKGKKSLTHLIGCYREKGKKDGVQKRLNRGTLGSGGKRKAA